MYVSVTFEIKLPLKLPLCILIVLPLMLIEPVTPKLPVICAEPVNGNPLPTPLMNTEPVLFE